MFNFKLKKKTPLASKSLTGLSQNPKVLEVNLIKNEMRANFDWSQHLGTLFISLLIAGLFVVEIYFGLDRWSAYENDRVLATEAKFNQVSKDIKAMKSESDQVLAFKQRVDLADALLADHIYWTNFLSWLEKNTLSTVSYGGFSGGVDGAYQLQATGQTFRDISWQTRAFLADPSVISARVDSGSSARSDKKEQTDASTGVSFAVNLKINPKIFKAAGK